MRIAKLLKTASPAASRLAALALAGLVLKTLVLNRWPAVFAPMYDLGILVEAVLASVVASYIFYLVVVHLKELEDRETVAPYVLRHTRRVVGDCENQVAELSKASNVPLALDNVTAAAMKQAFTAIAPYSQAPLILAPANVYANWFQYFDFYKSRSRESIARVMAQLIFLDAQHVSLLAAIDDNIHFSVISHALHTKIGNTDLAAFADTFLIYCEQCLKLKRYMTERGWS